MKAKLGSPLYLAAEEDQEDSEVTRDVPNSKHPIWTVGRIRGRRWILFISSPCYSRSETRQVLSVYFISQGHTGR